MKSELNLGVLFTGELDPLFGATIKKIQDSLGKLEGATKKVTEAEKTQTQNRVTMQKGLQSYIRDVEFLLRVQARWYAAKFVLFAAVEFPVSTLKKGLAFFAQIDEAEAKIRRYGAMMGDSQEEVKRTSHELILLARQLNLEYAASFDEIVKGADRLIAAGANIKDVMGGVLEEFVKFQTAWPETEMDKFTKAMVSMRNTFIKIPEFANLSELEIYTKMLDKVTVALGIGVIEAKDLPKLLNHFTQIAQAAGLSVDEMLTLDVLVTNLGKNAGSAARALRGLMTSLVQPDKLKLFEQLGIEIKRNIPIGQQLISVMEQLRTKVTGTGEKGLSVGAMSILGKLTSTERLDPLIALIRNLKEYDEIKGKIEKSEGANQRASDEMNKTFKAQWKLILELNKEMVQSIFNSEFLGREMASLNRVLRGTGIVILTIVTGFRQWVTALEAALTLMPTFIHYMVFTLPENLKKFSDAIKTSFGKRSLDPIKEFFKEVDIGLLKSFGEDFEKKFEGINTSFNEMYAILTGQRIKGKGKGKTNIKSILAELEEWFTPDKLEKTKDYGSSLIASSKAILNAKLAMEIGANNLSLKLLENKHKLGLISEEAYYKRRDELLNDSIAKEKAIVDNEWKDILAQHEKGIRAEDDKAKRKKLIAAKEADEARKSRKIAEIEHKREGQIDDNTTKKILDNIQKEQDALTQKYELDDIRRENSFNREKFTIDQLRSRNDWLFSHNLISAEQYYAEKQRLSDEELAHEKENLQKAFDIWKAYTELMIDVEPVPKKRDELNNEIIKRQAKLNSDLNGLDEERLRASENTNREIYDDWEMIYKDGKILGVVKRFSEKSYNEFVKLGANIKTIFEGVFDGMQTTFSDFFYDAWTGQLKSAQDYFISFAQSVLRTWSDLMSRLVTEWLWQQAITGLARLAGARTTEVGGVPVQKMSGGGYAALNYHKGGIVGDYAPKRNVPISLFDYAPRLHKGLNPDEFPAILQKGEEVISKEDRGKKAPINQQNYDVNLYINTIDAQSFQSYLNMNRDALAKTILAMKNDNHPMRKG